MLNTNTQIENGNHFLVMFQTKDFIYMLNITKNLMPILNEMKASNFSKPMVIFGTEGDTYTFSYFSKLCQLYPQAKSHVFKGKGGHHYIFLNLEKCTKTL